jgi:hypothetical protein
MSWVITPTYDGLVSDSDAAAYLAAVQAADGQLLEPATRQAINAFVVGCKADGIWTAIKASCILAGARTLAGALVPLVGTAPTNFNFVSGDYNRKTGLKGDTNTSTGVGTKYLDSNRAGSAQGQDNLHMSVYISENNIGVTAGVYMGNGGLSAGNSILFRTAIGAVQGINRVNNRNATSDGFGTNPPALGFFGSSRSSNISYNTQTGGKLVNTVRPSETMQTNNFNVFGLSGSTDYRTNARLAFYSIGESLDLALLDTRITALITAISTAF